MLHMYPDLMSAAGFQTKGDQAVPVFLAQDSVMGDCRLTMFKVHNPLNDGAGLAGQRRIDSTALWCDLPPNDGKIFPVELVPAYHVGEDACADQMLCNYRKTGSIAVQPVTAAENKWFILFLIVPKNSYNDSVRGG